MARPRQWVRTTEAIAPVPPDTVEKAEMIAACEALIRDYFKPRHLARIVPTEFTYCVDIHGAYAGGRYRFIQRYRSGFPETLGEEFDAPFARIDRVGKDTFDLYWMRHTGKWWRLHANLTLEKAIETLRADGLLQPL